MLGADIYLAPIPENEHTDITKIVRNSVEKVAKKDDTVAVISSFLNHVLLTQTVMGLETEIQLNYVEEKPDIIALSALLSVTIGKVKETIKAISDTSLRKDLKIIIGGSCLNPRIAEELGADAFGRDAWDGVNQAKQLISS